MVSKKDKDAESGLQVLSVLSIIWAIGFFYWSRDGTILGYVAGQLPFFCCSTFIILLIVIFLAAWMFTRKENSVKKFLDEHFKSSHSISVDVIAIKFLMKRIHAIRSLNSWAAGRGVKGDYDETTGLFVVQKDSSPAPSSSLK
jgi:low affinity Fe/Cu permease